MSKEFKRKHTNHRPPKYNAPLEPYEDLKDQIYKAINEVEGQQIIRDIIINKMVHSPDKEFFEKFFETILKEKLTDPNGKAVLKKILIDIHNESPQIFEEIIYKIEEKRTTTFKKALKENQFWFVILLLVYDKVSVERIKSLFSYFF